MITNHKYGLRDTMGLNSKILLVSLLTISFGYMIYSYVVVDSLDCSEEKGECYSTTVSMVIDGNVIRDSDGRLIELSLVSVQESYVSDGKEPKEYVESVCPVGSSILVDEDDLRLSGRYDEMISKFCNKDMPAVGISFGLDRIFNSYKGKNKSITQVYVILIKTLK